MNNLESHALNAEVRKTGMKLAKERVPSRSSTMGEANTSAHRFFALDSTRIKQFNWGWRATISHAAAGCAHAHG